MGNSWVLAHVRGKRYRVINNTGQTAHKVTFGIRGAMVATPFGDPAWSLRVDEIPHGEGIEEVFAIAMGTGQAITVSWTDSAGSTGSYQIPLGR